MPQPNDAPVSLQLVLAHSEPLWAQKAELEETWRSHYGPLFEMVERRGLRIALHLGGHLLDFLARQQEGELLRIKRLAQARQIEVLGGLFYDGAPALLSELDVRGQLQMAMEFWESLLGWAPTGFFLSQLAWSLELPRLCADCGLDYGFVGSHQVLAPGREYASGLGVIERGEQRLAAWVLDAQLSATLTARPVDEWLDALLDRASGAPGPLSVWLPARKLVDTTDAWRDAFFSALSGGRPEVQLVLPGDSYAEARPAQRLRLDERCPPELQLGPGITWPDLPRLSAAVDTLHRRIQRASGKLKDAIETMEDEELEGSWSDALATAQRLIFSAQGIETYLRPPPALVTEVLARLVRAEAMIDALVQGEDDWVAIEEDDADGDMLEEVFVCTRHLTCWLVPAAGARLRCLDLRRASTSIVALPPSPTDSSPRTALTLPGLGERLLDQRASAAELFSGTAVELFPKHPSWQLAESAIDEDGDCAYHMTVCTGFNVDGVNARSLTIDKSVSIPIDVTELQLHYKLTLAGEPEVVFATEMPFAFRAPVEIFSDGHEVLPGTSGQKELLEVSTLRLEAADGCTVQLLCMPAAEVWVERREPHTVVVAPVVHLESEAEASYSIRFLSGDEPLVAHSPATPPAEATATEELFDEDEPTQVEDNGGEEEEREDTSGEAQEAEVDDEESGED